VEHWTVLPGGAHVLSAEGWFQNDRAHREGRPAWRSWRIGAGGTSVLAHEEWWRRGILHRSTGPSYREWTVEPDGIRTLQCESWCVNGNLHRVDGPALGGREYYWLDVRQEEFPWLRRGRRGLLVPLVPWTGAAARKQVGDGSTAPAWSRDTRVIVTAVDSGATYRSAVGGTVLLCV